MLQAACCMLHTACCKLHAACYTTHTTQHNTTQHNTTPQPLSLLPSLPTSSSSLRRRLQDTAAARQQVVPPSRAVVTANLSLPTAVHSVHSKAMTAELACLVSCGEVAICAKSMNAAQPGLPVRLAA